MNPAWLARKTFRFTLALAMVLAASLAQATVINWVSTGSSTWTNGPNWSGGITPGSGDDVVFNTPGTVSCTIPGGITVNSISIQTPYTNTVTVSSSFTVTGGVTVGAGTLALGSGVVSAGSFSQTGGIINAGSTSSLTVSGNFNLSAGIFNANTGTVTLNSPNPRTLSSNSPLNMLNLNGAGAVTLNGNLQVNGGLIESSGTPFNLNGFNLTLDGSFSPSASFNAGTGSTVAFAGTTNHTINPATYPNLYISSSGTANLNVGAVAVTGDLTVSGVSTLSLSASGSLDLKGDFNNAGIFLAGGRPVSYSGAGNQIVASVPYFDLTINKASGTADIQAGLSTSGIFTVAAGTARLVGNASVANLYINPGATLAGNGFNFNVSGNWNNQGSYMSPAGSQVTLNGGSQSIYGTNTFCNLVKITGGPSTLTFETGMTQAITGNLTLNGSLGNMLSLRSSSSGSLWSLDPQGSRNIQYVDVKDSNNVNGTLIDAYATGSFDSGNNSGWQFNPPPTPTPGPVGCTLAYANQWSIGAGFPAGVETDATDHVFVADITTGRVHVYDSTGTWQTDIGATFLTSPSGVALDAVGNIFVANTGGNNVRKFDAVGTLVGTIGGPGNGPGQFNNPAALAFDSSGNLYVADSSNNRVEKFDSGGLFVASFTPAGLNDPEGIAVDNAAGLLYVSDTTNDRIQVLTLSGTWLRNINGAGTIFGPKGLTAIEGATHVIVASSGDNRIVELDTFGAVVNSFGGFGSASGLFDAVNDVALSHGVQGIYVTDSNNHRVQFIACPNNTPTDTPLYTATFTSSYTWTPSFSPTATYTSTATPSATATPTPTPTAGATPVFYHVGSGQTYTTLFDALTAVDTDEPGLNFLVSRVVVIHAGAYAGFNLAAIVSALPDASHKLSIEAFPGDHPDISAASGAVVTLNRPHTHFRGLNVGVQQPNGYGIVVQAANVEVAADYVYGDSNINETGILLDGASNAVVAANLVNKCQVGLQTANAANSNYVLKNTFVNFSNVGMDAPINNSVAKLLGNVFHKAGGGPVMLSWAPAAGNVSAYNIFRNLDTAPVQFFNYSLTQGLALYRGWFLSNDTTSLDADPNLANWNSNNPVDLILGGPAGQSWISGPNLLPFQGNDYFGTPLAAFAHSGFSETAAGPTPTPTPGGGCSPAYQGEWGDLFQPKGLVTSASDDVFVVDSGSGSIKKFDAAGVFLQSWGSLNSPTGIAIGGPYLYVTDSSNDQVIKYDFFGNVQTQWGSSGSGTGQFAFPTGIAVGLSGTVMVVDRGNNRVQRFDPNGTSMGEFPTQFNSPMGIAIDLAGGFIYVSDASNHIEKFDMAGTPITAFGIAVLNNPGLMKVNSGSGDLLVADTGNNQIVEFDSAGNSNFAFGGPGTGPGQFDQIFDISNGHNAFKPIYVSDSNNSRVQVFACPGFNPIATATYTSMPSDTPTMTLNATQTAVSLEATATEAAVETAVAVATETSQAAQTQTAVAVLSETPTWTDTYTFTPSNTPTATPSSTQTPNATLTAASQDATSTQVAVEATSTAMAVATETAQLEQTQTAVAVLSYTFTSTNTDTFTPSHTPTSSPTSTQTPNATLTAVSQDATSTQVAVQATSTAMMVATQTAQSAQTQTAIAVLSYTSTSTNTDTFTPSNTATATPTSTQTPNATQTAASQDATSTQIAVQATSTALAVATQTAQSQQTQTAIAVLSYTSTSTNTDTFTPSNTSTATPSSTQTPNATLTAASQDATSTQVAAQATSTALVVATQTAQSAQTQTAIAVLSYTSTATPSDTFTPTNSFTSSFTPTNTFTSSFTPTNTFTSSNTATSTFTSSNTATNTFTPSPTFTNSFTSSSTLTSTSTATDTFTLTPSSTATTSFTFTPSFTSTDTSTLTSTSTSTNTPSSTNTFTPSDTATNTTIPTSTNTVVGTATFTPTPSGGDGSALLAPGLLTVGRSAGIEVDLTYTAGTQSWAVGGILRITIPGLWPAPQKTNATAPNYLSVAVTGGSLSSLSLSGSVVTIRLSSLTAGTGKVVVAYKKVNAPMTEGNYAFVTESDPLNDGSLKPIAQSPSIDLARPSVDCDTAAGISQGASQTGSVSGVGAIKVAVAPNPAKAGQLLCVTLGTPAKWAHWTIYDLSGNPVGKADFGPGAGECYSPAKLASGIYFLKIEFETVHEGVKSVTRKVAIVQ